MILKFVIMYIEHLEANRLILFNIDFNNWKIFSNLIYKLNNHRKLLLAKVLRINDIILVL